MTRRDAAAAARLRQGLDPAVRALARARSKAAVRRMVVRVTERSPWLWLVVLCVTFVLSRLFVVPLFAPAVAFAVVTAIAVLGAGVAARRTAVRLLDAAQACDRAHEAKDRLSAALELAAAAPGSRPLGEALAALAIEDGLRVLPVVDPGRVAVAAAAGAPRYGRVVLGLLASVLWTALLPAPVETIGNDLTDSPGQPASTPGETTQRVETAAAEPRGREPVAGAQSQPPPAVPRPAASKRDEPPAPVPAEAAPAVPAATGAGRSGSDEAAASAQRGAPKATPSGSPGAGRPGSGQGAAAAGAAEAVPDLPQPQTRPPRPKPTPGAQPKSEPEQRPSEGAPSPSGQARGSGRMAPVGNKRQDLNRGMERDDDPEVEDEAIEDETEEQEQRGGVTPMRRQDQRPAARELSISGDGPPDQGRGGPTPPKKARGTASLVLGLRLPDQVRGQPNPGTAKTSVEQLPPRRLEAEPGLALPAPSGRPGTPQSRRPTAGPLDRLLAAYHEELRAQEQPRRAGAADPNPDDRTPERPDDRPDDRNR